MTQCRWRPALTEEYWTWGFWFRLQSVPQSTTLVSLYSQCGKECRWRCCVHICAHVQTASKMEWAREWVSNLNSDRHFRFQETTEKGTSVRSPGLEGSVWVFISLSLCTLWRRWSLPSSNLKTLRDFGRPRCAKGQRDQYTDLTTEGVGGGTNRKSLQKGSQWEVRKFLNN